MVTDLENVSRLLMEVELTPVQGTRFQPTGFPDMGAAIYERPDGKRMILVETAQSMANRLEQVCMDGFGPHIAKELEGLPYILAKLVGDVTSETSSLFEAHRINSPFIMTGITTQNQKFKDILKTEMEYAKGRQIDWKKVAKVLFKYDPNALLHGVFLANFEDGRIKIPRALTGFIEAEDIREAASGGVKNNPLDPTGKIRAEDYDKDVYSNVPYHRMEFSSSRITAYFNFDLALLDGYGLGKEGKGLLVNLGLYKIARFLNSGLRLRTACDFKTAGDVLVKEPASFSFPSDTNLLKQVQEGIDACRRKKMFADPPVTELNVKVKDKEMAGKETESKEESDETETEEGR